MVTVRYAGRTGNQLFGYAFARMIATKNNITMCTDWPHQGFVKTSPHPQMERHDEPVVHINDMYRDSHDKDWHHQDFRGKRIYIHGFFQHPKYYDQNEAMVKSFFQLRPIGKRPPNEIVCHLRLGDYFAPTLRSVIHPRWHQTVLYQMGYRPNGGNMKLYFVLEDPNDPFFREHYHRFNPAGVVSHANAADDFHFIRSFDNIICSNSSFAWWAAWLSEARRIITFSPWMREPHGQRIRLALTRRAKPVTGTWHEGYRKGL